MAMIDRNFTFATNGTVTANDLHNLIDSATIYQDLITGQQPITSVGTNYELLIADGTNPNAAPNAVTVYDLFEDALTAGTYTNANISAALSYGTATGTRLVSTNATITTGTITTGVIPTLTAGTTTSTAATITSGTITNLASTTGTIGNLSTTLAGDFTISSGTGTLGTTGATLGTYGGATSVPVLAINAKGQVTSTGTAAITSGLTGFRNRIINGDMRIDQRNAGASVTLAATGSSYSSDRWFCENNTTGTATIQQISDAPSGFTNSIIFTVTAVDSSISSTEYCFVRQAIEGHNISDLAWGSASASTITLSFWVKSSLTGTFGGALRNSANNRSYPFTYTISLANTWEKKTITISGDTSGTWVTDNGLGVTVFFGLAVGSSLTGASGAWAGANNLSANGSTNVISTLSATWQITGVQLEAGSTATEFERRPIGTELALCQRYYWKNSGSGSTTFHSFGLGIGSTTTNVRLVLQHPIQMRAAPSLLDYGTIAVYDGVNIGSISAATFDVTAPLVTSINLTGTSLTQFRPYEVIANNNSTANIGLGAEL